MEKLSLAAFDLLAAHVFGAAHKNMSHATRRRAANVPVAVPIATAIAAAAPLEHPSGRFDDLIDMGNPMKGINLFPYLRRHAEGRALGALGPAAVLELSRTVREAVMPRRWPREVFFISMQFMGSEHL